MTWFVQTAYYDVIFFLLSINAGFGKIIGRECWALFFFVVVIIEESGVK